SIGREIGRVRSGALAIRVQRDDQARLLAKPKMTGERRPVGLRPDRSLNRAHAESAQQCEDISAASQGAPSILLGKTDLQFHPDPHLDKSPTTLAPNTPSSNTFCLCDTEKFAPCEVRRNGQTND